MSLGTWNVRNNNEKETELREKMKHFSLDLGMTKMHWVRTVWDGIDERVTARGGVGLLISLRTSSDVMGEKGY